MKGMIYQPMVFLLILDAVMPVHDLEGQAVKRITILHTNDMHSRLTGFAPESAYTPLSINDDRTRGGFARIATIIKRERENRGEATLVLDAGDFLMGTLFQSLEVSTGFQLRLMKKMGYDAVCLGNHEFDYGPGRLASIINSSVHNGEIPSLLLGNVEFSKRDSSDDSFKRLFTDKIIGRKLIIARNGLKIGLFSILGKVAAENAAFAKPVTFSRQIAFARKMVKELEGEKCDIIICLSHSGVGMNSRGEWTGEDVELAAKVSGINIIISGHTHTRLDKPLVVNGIPIVQTGEYGQYVGRLSFTYENRKISFENYSLIPVDDRIQGDPEIHQLIEDQKKLIVSQVLRPLGMDYIRPVAETDFLLECNEYGNFIDSNLGPMTADAIRLYVNDHNKAGTDVSMVAVGIIRDRIVPGIQTAPDIFRIMSMGTGKDGVPGYPLSRLYVTGRELKNILEVLLVACKSAPENYCYYSGINVDFDPDRRLLKKIIRIELLHPDGKRSVVDLSRKNTALYSITANSYMLEFIGIIKKMSFGLINVVPKDSQGNPVKDMSASVIDFDERKEGVQEGKEWLALVEFLSAMKDLTGNGIPDIDKKYSVAVKCFHPVVTKKAGGKKAAGSEF
jgi:5'-nucleotidase / UDP-sugar diphosphatase